MPRLATLALLVSLLLAWSPAPATHAAAQAPANLKVVTTFSVLNDLVANVGGDAIDLATIVPAGGDAHSFDPKPDQVASIAGADLVFEIGLGFEPWLPDMISASGTSAREVAVTTGLDVIEATEHHDEGDNHDHGDTDPHVWGDVRNAIAIVATVRDALAAADPANAAAYQANAAAYTQQLQDLDTFIRGQVATLPADGRKLVTSHDTLGYFARAYGFDIVGTALGSVTTEAGDPSAKEIANLIDQIQSAHVPAIFPETVSNPELIETIAGQAGVKVGPPLYTDSLGEPGSDGDTYIDMMRYNATSIVTALSGT